MVALMARLWRSWTPGVGASGFHYEAGCFLVGVIKARRGCVIPDTSLRPHERLHKAGMPPGCAEQDAPLSHVFPTKEGSGVNFQVS
ncbi:MAG: hypothetical protein CL912_12280 [Deltaproteobacteria bacterium]|nr:hypothetical protein [Deltaproteobacteria bacterium]